MAYQMAKKLSLLLTSTLALSACVYRYDGHYDAYQASDDVGHATVVNDNLALPNSPYAIYAEQILGLGGSFGRVYFDTAAGGFFRIRNQAGFTVAWAVRQWNGDYVLINEFDRPLMYLVYTGGGYYRIEDPLGFYYGYFDYYDFGRWRYYGFNDYHYANIWFSPYYFTPPYRGFDRKPYRKKARAHHNRPGQERHRRDAVYHEGRGYDATDWERNRRNQSRDHGDKRNFDDMERRARLRQVENRAALADASRSTPQTSERPSFEEGMNIKDARRQRGSQTKPDREVLARATAPRFSEPSRDMRNAPRPSRISKRATSSSQPSQLMRSEQRPSRIPSFSERMLEADRNANATNNGATKNGANNRQPVWQPSTRENDFARTAPTPAPAAPSAVPAFNQRPKQFERDHEPTANETSFPKMDNAQTRSARRPTRVERPTIKRASKPVSPPKRVIRSRNSSKGSKGNIVHN